MAPLPSSASMMYRPRLRGAALTKGFYRPRTLPRSYRSMAPTRGGPRAPAEVGAADPLHFLDQSGWGPYILLEIRSPLTARARRERLPRPPHATLPGR